MGITRFLFMGIFFGNVWYAAIQKLDFSLSGLYTTSLMPDGTGRTVHGLETLSDDYCFDETTWTNFDFTLSVLTKPKQNK